MSLFKRNTDNIGRYVKDIKHVSEQLSKDLETLRDVIKEMYKQNKSLVDENRNLLEKVKGKKLHDKKRNESKQC